MEYYYALIHPIIIAASELRTQDCYYYEKLDAKTIYAKEGNAGVKKTLEKLLSSGYC